MTKYCLTLAFFLVVVPGVHAHDTWVQTNTNICRVGDNVFIDLMLGNHGNDHRDFKLAGKVDPAKGTLEVIGPDGKRYDLKERLTDLGYTPKEGFWNVRFAGAQPGLYLASHTSDGVVSYAPKRSVRSAKTFFVLSKSLDKVPQENPGFDKVLGHPFELVPESNPVTPMGPGQSLKVRLYFKGKPLANEKISFIPRGHTLAEGFDKTYERMTDDQGRASFTFKEGNYHLIVAHREEKEAGKGYDTIKYAATLAVFVPQLCPCCDD